MRKKNGALASGKFLPFEKWKRCLNSYKSNVAGEKITDIGKKIMRRWPGHYEDPANAFNKIKREIKEAKRLIESSAAGTFPH